MKKQSFIRRLPQFPLIPLFLFCVLSALTAALITGCESSEMNTGDLRMSPSAGMKDAAKGSANEHRPEIDAFALRSQAQGSPNHNRDPETPTGNMTVAHPGDELWVIARPSQSRVKQNDDVPGSGSMVTQLPDDPNTPRSKKTVPLPLKHTHVKARVDGYVATVDVTQQFHNPFDQKIEAVYVFPLPQNAAVNDFVMTIGDRKIRGVIRGREEAERIYKAAKHAGHNASLLTQERPNIFTQKVANIEPGKQIDINIKYFNTLAYSDGWYEFVFPMVVGPRFNPPHTSTVDEGIGAVGRGQHGASGQSVEVQYLRSTERSGHDIALSVNVNAGVAIEEMICPSHRTETAAGNDGSSLVQIKANDSIPNKDFVLRWRVAGDQIKSNMLVHRDRRGGFFSLMIYPPKDMAKLPRQPMEMIFVLDCSGSMNGYPMAKSKAAIHRALNQMDANDTFQVIRFSNEASQLGNRPLLATADNLRRATQYVNRLSGRGGTRMIEGIKASLDFPHEEGRQRVVAFLTDGYIGNETEVLGEVTKRLDGARIFSFGVGDSVNRYLVERLAVAGRGAVAYVGRNDDGAAVMDHFFNRVSHPALTESKVNWGSMSVKDVFPRRVPDLFVGRPILMVGRFEGEPPSNVTLRGKAGGLSLAINVPVKPTTVKTASTNPFAPHAIPAVWARMQIADLSNQMTHTDDPQGELPDEIKRVALDYNLMSAYTAFVAVDGSRKTAGNVGTTVPVPVPVPEGVKYETTVQEQ